LRLNPTIIITKGERGSILYDKGQLHEIPIVSARRFVDPTGAGDGYRAGLLCGLANDLELIDACRLGAVVSSFVVGTIGAQTQRYSLEAVKRRFAETFGENLGI
jgi:sugar/nucleoside kinase (ribokinase family)